ncbi:MAG: exodeoxyribonuclease-3 [Flavobacteriaceae bacterium]|jgi:exodeoxyribonuclease-3
MKILNWNVNGLRAIERKGNLKEIFSYNADIICFQEIKAEKEQLSEEVVSPEGYFSYFWSSQERKGYSGVAIYSKEEPLEVKGGFPDNPDFDTQGRMLTAYFKDFILITCYFPNGGGGPDRLSYKLAFYDLFLEYIEELKKKYPKIIFCGDINTAHTEIDIARPKENEKNTGFLPEERAWIDEIVHHGWTDVFRHLYPNKIDSYTYWDVKTRARERNVGWRIDYFFMSPAFLPCIKSISHETLQEGSDHCPLLIELDQS